ncbi:K Homology domain type 1 [Penicillium atrosanguineum]|uniref:Mediator complex subunit Med13 n=1 Tax=Penicillium atrosanguineum TaxID=1132637 RepID=UPI0023837B86|nr:Mediator complex subunit Med13 [Penicillium atrosanguineum]KAJ5125904.1 K Homology domain type 1 [Penicillium atrosanguineum]KAJ5136662.1 K Homology domain type 1 [Penicillium atrosanguineum]KAJ5292994.1 Mediator complex subunit Med13 [Penicillium atrosanguineum]
MAAQASATNGGSQSLAAMLEAQHEAHKPTVEEVVDEEDLKHPPPSAIANSTPAPAAPIISETSTPAESATPAPKPAAKKAPAFDVQSDELFPALGSGPKPTTPAAATWGANKPSAAAAVANGQTAKPMNMPRVMSLPGKHLEQLRLAPSQMQPRGQLKKPLRDILRDISRRSKANVDMRGGPGGSIIFEGKGSVDSVRQALKEVAQQVGSKQSVKVPIPTSARPHIIGRQGAVVQDIQTRTGARVQVPRADNDAPADDDDEDTIDVLIEGDAVAAEMARREIEAIVKERGSSMSLRLKTIPPEFFPFIAGAHDATLRQIEERTKAQVSVPRYDTWTSQPPPQEAHPGQVQFFPVADKHILISGERAAAQEARAEIERMAAELQRNLTLRQLAINRGQHQFILGNEADALHLFLAQTGCAIVLPPASDESEFLTITGPLSQIENGINHAMDLATSMQMASIDLSRQHPAAPAGPHAHARALTQYLRRREVIRQLESAYDAHIALPQTVDGPVNWEVYSRDGKNTIRARSDIMNLVQAYPPSRLRHIPVDPYFHSHLRSQSARHIQSDYGVHLLVPDDAESPEVVLVYEGPSATTSNFEVPRQRPSPAEVAAFEKSLQEAQEYLLNALGNQQDIVGKSVSIPAKYQEKARRFIIREQDAKGEDSIPVRAIVGEPRGGSAEIALRGPSGLVDELAAKLAAFVVEQEQDDLERGYTTTFDFPQKYANILIGKRGENINKLREEFDVDIKVENGKVEVKGPKAKADAARMRIINMGKKLEDESTHILKIAPQYHRELIGQRGNQVNRLQDRYNVRVQFPRAAAVPNDDQSVIETGSDAGGARAGRPQQAADEVLVKGPSKGADQARDEILSLLQWVIDHSHSATISVAQNQIASLIGQRGREMDKLRADTGAQIDVPSANDAPDASGRVQIRVKGTKQQVAEAKKVLEQRATEFDATVTKSIEVDKKYHKALIGGGGANIRKIVTDAGGPNDGSAARMVRFPRPDSTESTIRLEGNGKIVDSIIAAIEEFVKEREDQVTEVLEVPTAQHRMLIGRGGDTRRGIESKFSVTLDIPKQGSGRTDVKLKGPSNAVAEAKEHIQGMLKEQHAETVDVPSHLHHVVADNGMIFRRLRNDHQVTVDHSGRAVPARAADSTRGAANGAMPLITDEPDMDAHSWNVVDNSAPADADATPFPWVLTGSPENVAKARAVIEKAISSASQQSATGYLILPDPKTYRFVVGQGGSQINAIRKKTGCRINVPKDQARGEAIEIRGSATGLEEAKDMILEAVQNGLNGSAR